MPKQEFNGDDTRNARIRIDYQGEKPRVDFSYPDKEKQYQGSAYSMVFMFWIIILALGYIGFAVIDDYKTSSYVSQNKIRFNSCYQQYINNWDEIISSTCSIYAMNGSYKYNKWNLLATESEKLKRPDTRELLFDVVMLFSLIFGCPALIYLPFRKKWKKVYPKWNAFLSNKKIAIFKPEHIIEQNGELFFEIPLFSNVKLNYEATGDFSKYLKVFEIVEHPFIYYSTRNKKKAVAQTTLNGKVKYLSINEWLWRARFYYTQKPKNGELKVIYR